MKELTLAQHRARIENINSAHQNNRSYLRRHRIRDYLYAQAVYNLGDYPAPFQIEPTQYDYDMLKDMAEKGVQLIQIHEEWNDSIRRFGADKYTSFDPKGLEHFIDLCHSFGIKIIPYISSGYLHVYDPDFRREFALRENYCNPGMHFRYQSCSASSAYWREFILPRTFRVLDTYAFDGIYNDWGLDSVYKMNGYLKTPQGANYDPDAEDLLSMMYTQVKKRGGVYKLHCDSNNPAPCVDRVYDYLWIGEGIKNAAVGAGKEFPYYVVPCQDKAQFNRTPIDVYFASVIPFMQFPLLTARGRVLTGESADQPIPYYGNENGKFGHEFQFNKDVSAYLRAHPNGPYVYSLWSSIPDDPDEYEIWCNYLALYRPMVEDNTVAYIELRDCADILSPIPESVYASMFVNEEKYLVVSNFDKSAYTLVLKDLWTDRQSGVKANTFTIEPGKMIFLKLGENTQK